MSRITVDEPLKAQLTGLEEPIEVCDQSGKPLGHFLPAGVYHDLVYALAFAEVDEKELEERRREPGGVTTAEAIAYLENLIKSKRQAS